MFGFLKIIRLIIYKMIIFWLFFKRAYAYGQTYQKWIILDYEICKNNMIEFRMKFIRTTVFRTLQPQLKRYCKKHFALGWFHYSQPIFNFSSFRKRRFLCCICLKVPQHNFELLLDLGWRIRFSHSWCKHNAQRTKKKWRNAENGWNRPEWLLPRVKRGTG